MGVVCALTSGPLWRAGYGKTEAEGHSSVSEHVGANSGDDVAGDLDIPEAVFDDYKKPLVLKERVVENDKAHIVIELAHRELVDVARELGSREVCFEDHARAVQGVSGPSVDSDLLDDDCCVWRGQEGSRARDAGLREELLTVNLGHNSTAGPVPGDDRFRRGRPGVTRRGVSVAVSRAQLSLRM